MDNKVFQEENHCYQFDFSSAVWATDGLHNTFQNYSGPYLPTTTQKSIVKMEIDEIRESRRIRKWKEGFGEETETSRGWLSHRLFLPLGGAVSSSRAQATLKLRMMIRTPDPVSDNQGSDAVGSNYTPRHSHGSRREAPSETRSRLCI